MLAKPAARRRRANRESQMQCGIWKVGAFAICYMLRKTTKIQFTLWPRLHPTGRAHLRRNQHLGVHLHDPLKPTCKIFLASCTAVLFSATAFAQSALHETTAVGPEGPFASEPQVTLDAMPNFDVSTLPVGTFDDD